MFENVFYPLESEPGRAKADAIGPKHRVFSPIFPHSPPTRVSWECIQEEISKGKAETVQAMAECKKNTHLAQMYDSLETISPTEVFFTGFAEGVLVDVFSDYHPENGLDADIFLIADDWENPRIRLEVFPRYRLGEMVTAYGSHLTFDIPYLVAVGAA